VLLCPLRAVGFYAWSGDNSYGDARALLRGFASAYRYPDEGAIYPDTSVQGIGGVARLMSVGGIGAPFGFEFNAYQSYIPSDLLLGSVASGAALDTERSAALDWSYSDDDYAHLAIDRLNARWSAQRLDVRVGRQPVNLATTFYFTPNDFFAPFAAQAFFRVYKPGVDAARADYRLDNLSTVSLISVLGYEPDAEAETEDKVGRLPSDSGQRQQLALGLWHEPAMVVLENPTDLFQLSGLGVVEAGRVDGLRNAILRHRRQVLRGRRQREQSLARVVGDLVFRAQRDDARNQQGEWRSVRVPGSSEGGGRARSLEYLEPCEEITDSRGRPARLHGPPVRAASVERLGVDSGSRHRVAAAAPVRLVFHDRARIPTSWTISATNRPVPPASSATIASQASPFR